MADKTPSQKPLQNEKPREKTIEELLSKDTRMMRSPILWFFLLGLPIVLTFCVALTQDREPQGKNQKMVSQVAPEAGGQGNEDVVVQSPGGVTGYEVPGAAGGAVAGSAAGFEGTGEIPADGGQVVPDMEQPPCEFSQWVGKKADSGLEQAIKAQNRPYRILAPGAMMTQDYSPSRVNFDVGTDGIVTRAWCG